MIPMARSSMLPWLRGTRRIGIPLFVALLLLAGAERRLAEIHLNLRGGGPTLESDDTLDGDEVRVRLVALNDDKAPTVLALVHRFTPRRTHVTPAIPPAIVLGRPDPRGPPAPSTPLA